MMLDANDVRAGDAGPVVPASAARELLVAATVVLLRDGAEGLEVLLLERPRDRGSFAGAWVFPGGKVDPADADEAAPGHPALGGLGDLAVEAAEEASARRAAVREVSEETGLELDAAQLVTTARWTPPKDAPKRFRTWFFTAPAPEGEVTLTAEESVDYGWFRPGEALRMHGDGELSLVPPTWVTLHGLASHRTVAETLDRAKRGARRDYVTRLGRNAGGPVLFWGEDVAYADDALIDAEGARHRLEIGTLPWVYSGSTATSG